MKYISHRGNLTGTNPNLENKPEYIDLAINEGFDVEIDIRLYNGEIYLGHDTPDYLVNTDWLRQRKERLWIHTKDVFSLIYLNDLDLRLFFHEKERHTIIQNTNLIWTHNVGESTIKSIIPLLNFDDIKLIENYNFVFGVCSDYIKLIDKK